MRNEKDVSSLSAGLGCEALCRPKRSPSSLHSQCRFSPLPGFGTGPFAPECASRRFAPRSSWLSHEPYLLLVRTASTARPGRIPRRPFFPRREGVWLVSQGESKQYRAKPRLSLEIGPAVRPDKAGDLRWFFSRRGHVHQTGLHCPNKVLAIVSMSGYVPNPAENLRDLKAPRSTPILMVNGQADATIPIADAHWGETNLKAQGYHPVFKTFAMGHRISPASLNGVRDFLAEVLPKN